MSGRLAWAAGGMAVAMTMASAHARADNQPRAQATVVASRSPSAGLIDFHPSRHFIRHDRVARRRFRGPRIIDMDGGAAAVPVPVPQETQDVYPIEPPFGGFGYRPPPPPAVFVAPQIIVLPTPKTSVSRGVRREASSPALTRRRRTGVIRPYARKLDVMAWRPFVWPLAYGCWPYAVGIVPSGFSPCNDQPRSALYNTPCGVPGYE